jgi:hypothetical protein
MSNGSSQDSNAVAMSVKASLQKAEGIISGRRKANTSLLVTGMTTSAASTLVAGITAAQGPLIGSGIEGWRVSCIIAAIFACAATISTGLSQQLKINDRILEGTQCVGKLKSLDVAITTGSRGLEEISKEYEEIAKTYPEFIS